MPLRSKSLTRLACSILILFFLVYSFLTAFPQIWRPYLPAPFSFLANHPVYPWYPWGMFFTSSYGHFELLVEGTHADGSVVSINLDQFSPETSHWVTEGNRLTWGVLAHLITDKALAGGFCQWVGAKYNATSDASIKIQSVDLYLGVWPLPPDTLLPPTQKELLAHCTL
jgi:hypothetical protein